jgi:hypothetical protein
MHYDDLDFTPASDHWSLPPQSAVDPLQNENQSLITIEYNKGDPKLSDKYEQSMHELGRMLKSEGMAYWDYSKTQQIWVTALKLGLLIPWLIISVSMNMLPKMFKLWKLESARL